MNVALSHRRPSLGEKFLAEGLINEQQLQQAVERQQETGCFLGQALVSLGFLSSSVVGKYMEESTGFPFIDLTSVPLDAEISKLIPETIARRKLVLPFAATEDTVCIAMV